MNTLAEQLTLIEIDLFNQVWLPSPPLIYIFSRLFIINLHEIVEAFRITAPEVGKRPGKGGRRQEINFQLQSNRNVGCH